MPTFQVTCQWCGGEKWPTLPERPKTYTCALCLSVPENTRQNRRNAAQKRVGKRWGKAPQ
jgi:hypothetical protein